jgi:hypothetical protein
MIRPTVYVAHMGKKRNIYSVLVGIAEEWRLLVRWRCSGKMMGEHGLDLCGEVWEHMTKLVHVETNL